MVDSKVAAVIDRAQASADSDDEDALIAALEEEEDAALDALRERRVQQLHSEVARAQMMRESGHGTCKEIKDEKELMDITTSTKLCVVHFFKPDFGRCGVMNSHLDTLAPRHLDTRFLKINVDNAPFLVVKLKIQVLPCVIAFVDGVGVDRVIGFEGLSNGNNFKTSALERRLLQSGVLVRAKMGDEDDDENPTSRKATKKEEQDDDDDDWD